MASTKWFLYGLFGGLILSMPASQASASQIQFGLAELPGTANPHGDSFVVTIPKTETSFIAHARELIDWVASGGDPLDSPGATILVTQIVAGADGINRNYLAEDGPVWSWHAVGTPSFVDFTIEILDGWPTFVEQDLEGWIDNTNGQIGFWGYTVVAELGPVVPEPLLAGDYNADGVVNAADYVVWRNNVGAPDGTLPNDKDGGIIGSAQYDTWRANYGATASSAPASGTAVPEPAGALTALIGGAALFVAWRRPVEAP